MFICERWVVVLPKPHSCLVFSANSGGFGRASYGPLERPSRVFYHELSKMTSTGPSPIAAAWTRSRCRGGLLAGDVVRRTHTEWARPLDGSPARFSRVFLFS